ncbi:MAG: hypothetical protein HC804_02550 [Anaerolineae bacterium]|nr:hypothetical protein [Anaerolineae bacterium]
MLVLVGHALQGNMTAVVWQNVFIAIPAAAVGLGVGLALDGRIPAPTFRKLVLILLLIIGLRLILF